MRDTPGTTSSLPLAATEVAVVRSICESMGIDPVEPERCKQAVTSQLPHCRLFHFAGHGYTDIRDPFQSKLLLDDWESEPLTVATLLEMNLRENSPFLAYLSASGAGQICNEEFTDESIHLISACQLAGFRHVIGTIWEVNDEVCVEMARITYEGMRDKGMSDKSVCLGLHYATRELRSRWVNKPVEGKHERDLVSKVDANCMEDEFDGDRIAMERDVRYGRLPRDVALVDDDEDDLGPAHWVPYVHVGV